MKENHSPACASGAPVSGKREEIKRQALKLLEHIGGTTLLNMVRQNVREQN